MNESDEEHFKVFEVQVYVCVCLGAVSKTT